MFHSFKECYISRISVLYIWDISGISYYLALVRQELRMKLRCTSTVVQNLSLTALCNARDHKLENRGCVND